MGLRVVSALVGALFVLGLGVYLGPSGLVLTCVVAMVLSTREFARMVFPRYRMPALLTPLYWLVSVAFFASYAMYETEGLTAFALANVTFFVGALWLSRTHGVNEDLLPALALGSFGLLYCALFPALAAATIRGPDGAAWFAFLLLVVFSGDTGAYLAGRAFGRRKFMPRISPNKTWEGSLGGLVGSAAAGTLFAIYVLPVTWWWSTLLVSLVVGFAAQSGDLLVSLVKRVAGVKDSGHIMPGHGGMLDRLDGVFIACPLVHAFSIWVNSR